MKNLKKALVLVLAFAMVFGMFTIGASAATSFNDDEDIVNKEAVSAMTQLGIINGYEDGTFLPKQVVTRAEMCKMICVALNGGVEPLLDTGATVFSDTAGHWASKYINYCYAEGIVSGDSGKGGPFRPDAAVTALEAAKMMLVALGYNSTVAGFTGADWAQNVAKEANRKGLFDGIGALNANAGLTRDNAAQLIYNGLFAEMVEYENSLGMDNGQLVTIPKLKGTGKTIIADIFKVKKVVGVLVANDTYAIGVPSDTSSVVAAANKGTINVFVRTIDGDDFNGTNPVDYKVTAPAEYLGQEVALFVKGSTVIGKVYTTTNNKVVSTKAELDSTDFTKLLKDNNLTVESNTATSDNGGLYANNYASYFKNNEITTTAITTNKNGAKLVLIDNDGDGKVEVVMQTEYTFDKVANYDEDAKKLILYDGGDSTEVNFEDCIGYEGLAKDDYVNYVVLNGKYVLSKAETVIGKMASYTGATKLTVGGTTYTISQATNNSDLTTVAVDSLDFTTTYKFYLDPAGNPIASETYTASQTDSNYAYVISSGAAKVYDAMEGESYTGTVKVLLTDGTVATYTVDMKKSAENFNGESHESLEVSNVETFAQYIANKKNTDLEVQADAIKGTIVTYTVADGKIAIAPTANYADGKDADDEDKTVSKGSVIISNTEDVVNSNTVFLFYNETTGKAVVATGISKIDKTYAVKAYVAENNVVKYVVVLGDLGTTTSNFYFIKSTATVAAESNKLYKTYTAIDSNGETVTLKLAIASKEDAKDLSQNEVYKLNVNAEGLITDVNADSAPNALDALKLGNTTDPKVFKGTVTAVNGEVVTVTAEDASANKIFFDSTGLKVWNISGTSTYAGSLAKNNKVTVVVDSAKVVVVFITANK